jgi:hypothetical protein
MNRMSNVVLEESNQEEEMKRMSNVEQGVSNLGCWNTRQYNAQLHKMNQEEERKNKLPTQLDGVQGVSNQGCKNMRQGNSGWQEQISMSIWQPSL